jgi:NAD(P)-dependent dehydrogenase (short-subunit alcohol dehydrogenase family)
MSDLKLEFVLISGANSPMEIGAAVASALSVKGADCFLTYLTRPGQLKDVSA